MLDSYLAEMSDEQIAGFTYTICTEIAKMKHQAMVKMTLAKEPEEKLAAALDTELQSATLENFGKYYDELTDFSVLSNEEVLKQLGCLDEESPSTINIYVSTFEHKDIINAEIEKYNKSVEESKQISYTDYMGLMMSGITTIINAITYVLIAFVAISLIVSSIMIGVITLISVQERTKEIGILRAIGASKKDVSSMFNAETLIIGFASGLLGVVVTYLLCIPINFILYKLTDLANLKAVLPIGAAIILVIISMVLTLISGIIPSRSAAKKDPVVALRTE
jgi:putative ABC transport system permease protein